MLKINRWFLIFLLGMFWPAVSILADEGSSSDIYSALSVASGASEETMPEPATIKGKTPEEMISKVTALAETASKAPALRDAASEEARPGIDSAVQFAQDEIRDPFATLIEPELPKDKTVLEGPVQPAGPPTEVNLQGIGFGSKDAYAIIGGEVFYTGDEKNGIKLLEVRRGEVDIQANGGKVTVPLFPGGDLQKAKDRAKKEGSAHDASLDQQPEIPGPFSKREQSPL